MLLLPCLLSCVKGEDPKPKPPEAECDPAEVNADPPPMAMGAPLAGVAEADLELPVGTPLSGYTSRCGCFGGEGKVDRRDSQYTYRFAPSAGVQTPIPVKAFWLSNGDQDLVVLKIDLIYSFDGLVEEMERRLSAATGKDLDGKVVVATNHSHAAHGDFSDQRHFYLGSDLFNYEVFVRMAEGAEAVALEAHDGLQPAKLGVGYAKDWDGGAVYHDRRGDNDDVQFFDDIPAGSYKDPYLTLLRIDTIDDQPLGVLFNFGMHGTSLDADNAMISIDAPGHVELVFEERFDTPVVVAMLQGAAGDASPGGSDDWFARLETVGEYAADPIEALWERTPTSADLISLETASRSVPETLADIRVTRGGTVDLRYAPYVDDDDFAPDEVVYNQDGSIASPIDEFNVAHGAAFCGEDPAYLPGYAPAESFPYVNCVDIDKMVDLIEGFFDLEDSDLPLVEDRKAAITAARIGPLPISEPDGTETTDDFFVGFFPGEPTATYTEQFRRRAAAELGFEHTMAVGYAQDHEGYLLIPEDWLQGGYEIDINVWGPLQGEHIMEQLLVMSGEVLATPDVAEEADACGEYATTDYGDWTLPTLPPDLTPEAGTLLAEPPAYLYSPLYSEEEVDAGVVPEIAVPAEVPRVQGIVAMAWAGGDPAVDYPQVTLQRRGEDGSWSDVLTAAGRPVSLGPDILLAHTPDPLNPPEATQTHTWYAAWQAVGHVADRAGLPLGTYRLHVAGRSWAGGDATWPWTTEDYTVEGDPFEVVAGAVTVAVSGSDVVASLAGPSRGWRLVGMDGNARGDNPLPEDAATITLVMSDGSEQVVEATGTRGGGVTTFAGVLAEGVVSVRVTDLYGNEGSLDL
ncbi:MAG: neutral/alkaline non-lysosomal ceramidase N-terminal domain-containing protein [Myxococcota bacterium]